MKCPKCNREVSEENGLCVEQVFTTKVFGYQYEENYVDLDISAGYCLLDEYIDNMMSAGELEVLGCQACLDEEV